ncbi:MULTISPECIES: tyrosine-type recombinase/integrase [Streptococcus anginosus group]|uniref:tyrosine-type recombinase/integrase n=1 Tax=Streptococcus anginosus group TaxID=671232 RepID=UPI00189787E8|nr:MULTISPECIES: tyrosine-type recombinase/integrase [Streptococcus anginosus group]
MTNNKRKDNKNRILKDGEYQRPNGTYEYRWRDKRQKRHVIYAKNLIVLREKQKQILKDFLNGLNVNNKITVDDLYIKWKSLKRGLKDNTFKNYQYLYEYFVSDQLGAILISNLKKSDIRSFYNYLAEERHVKVSTIDSIHTVLHQVLQIALDDEYITNNPSDNALKELKQSRTEGKKTNKALTLNEQLLFEKFLETSSRYKGWYPVFITMLWTGLRVGEITGLRWEDIDFENDTINVNHTLVYYDTRTQNGVTFAINTPKTKAGERIVPLLPRVKEALLMEKERQTELDITCKSKIDGYTNFIFLNRFGNVFHQGTLNKALKRIVRDCNFAVLDGIIKSEVMLPNFSNHTLRHTFTTRMVETGTNMKAMQEILGHSDISTTMNIYAEATKELKEKEMVRLGESLENSFSKLGKP